MAVVHVTRLPNSVRMPKLIFKMKDILTKCNIKKFWIKELADMRDSDLKEAKIQFLTNNDAANARQRLHRLQFIFNNQSSQLTAVIIQQIREPRDTNERHTRQYSRERSRSPIYDSKSKLDMELEFLRKQRMIIEEERRLLLECKKLEMIKDYGASACREFERMERNRERSRDRDRDFGRERRGEFVREHDRHNPRERIRGGEHARVRDRPTKPPQVKRSKTPLKPGQRNVLPKFVLPCRLLLAQMRDFVYKKCQSGEKSALLKLLNATLRKRIALALKDENDFKTTNEIIQIYRELYPIETDKELVMSNLMKIQMCHWIKPKKAVATSAEEDPADKSPKQDVAHSYAGDSPNVDDELKNPSEKAIKNDIDEEPRAEIKEANKVVLKEEDSHIEKICNENNKTINEETTNEVNSNDIKQISDKDIELVMDKNIEENKFNLANNATSDLEPEEEGDVSTVELMIDGPDEDWLVDGTDWNDYDESEDA